MSFYSCVCSVALPMLQVLPVWSSAFLPAAHLSQTILSFCEVCRFFFLSSHSCIPRAALSFLATFLVLHPDTVLPASYWAPTDPWGNWPGEFADSAPHLLYPKPFFLFCGSFHFVLSSPGFMVRYFLFVFSIQSTLYRFAFCLLFFPPFLSPSRSICNSCSPVLSHLGYLFSSSFQLHSSAPSSVPHQNNHVIRIVAN